MQKRQSILCLGAAFLLIFSSCGSNDSAKEPSDGESAFSADSMRQHIAVLAADSLMGRKPFTEGETKTLRYLQQ